MTAARASLGVSRGVDIWSVLRANPGRFLIASGAVATTTAVLWDVAPQLREPPPSAPPAPSTETAAAPPTRVQTATSRLELPAGGRPWLTGLSDGFTERFTRPVETIRVLVRATAAQRPPEDQISKMLRNYGVLAVGRAASPYVFDPQRLVVAAEREAQNRLDQVKARMARIHIDVLTCKITPWDVVSYYRKLRRDVMEAERQARALPADTFAAYNALYNYCYQYKIYTYMGALGAGLAQSIVVKRTLSKPSERLFGPAFSAIATGVTMPVRPVVPKSVAQLAGRAIARSLPGALVMGLTMTATAYQARDDWREFMAYFAKDHPELMGTLERELEKSLKSSSGGKV